MGVLEDFSDPAVKTIGTLEVLAASVWSCPPRSASRRFWCRWLPPVAPC
jgi:hypothetical protein